MENNLPPLLLILAAAARTAIVIVVLVVLVRLVGRRNVGEMNLVDIITILLVGNAVQNAMTFGSGSLGVGLASMLALLLMDRTVGSLSARFPWLQHKLFGGPVVIFQDGKMNREAMKREGVEEDELLAAVRAQGLAGLDRAHLAVLEENGEISVIPKEDAEEGQESEQEPKG